ncbi:uncharacterized protein IUM83_07187 [Phytophthora cinnamomi]|uniref:uncharacterized protein n=1 Tax=Phytophthora cinnamomi TaxID=4785 RepID=UPI00355A1169|nr:hypothetical protein IUM83_07187 [Phytophthora cinnamomi]
METVEWSELERKVGEIKRNTVIRFGSQLNKFVGASNPFPMVTNHAHMITAVSNSAPCLLGWVVVGVVAVREHYQEDPPSLSLS